MNRSKSASDFVRLRIQPWGLITAGGAVASTATILASLGRAWWFFDLFSHFRIQYFWGLTAVAIILLFPRRYKASACFGIIALANLYTIVPLYLGKPPQPSEISSSCRAMLINVNTEFGKPDKVAETIHQLKPDFLVLQEVNEQWLSALSGPLRAYIHSEAMPREDNFGIALYSKFPFIQSEIQQVGEADVPSVLAEVEPPAGRLLIVATHPLPPAGAENSRLRNDQFVRVGAAVKQAKVPVLLLGDLNATPWSWHFKRLLRESGLRDSSQGRGPLPTWPSYLPILLIPIDHCLHTKGVHVSRKFRGPKVGSDHYPIVVDFALTRSS